MTTGMLNDELKLLDEYRSLLEGHFGQILSLLNDRAIKDISEKYRLNAENRKVDIGFNLFTIISDIYHQENFHSDILKVILDPEGRHKEGDKYLRLFLRFLNEKGAKINPNDYSNAIVFREKGKIDLLIEDRNTKRAIIIENKIYDAPDQNTQLPRYLDYVKDTRKCKCDAIVYLRLNQKKEPDTNGWTETQRKEVFNLLIRINAYDENELDLLSGWINNAEKQSTHIDVLFALRQYGALIKHLGGNVMNKPIMEMFYNEMQKENAEKYKTALSLRSMMDDLPRYRVENIFEKFENNPKPFKQISTSPNKGANFFNLPAEKSNLNMDIWVTTDIYVFDFWDSNDKGVGVGSFVKTILGKMNLTHDLYEENNRMRQRFVFPEQEQELLVYIEDFKKKLAEVLPNMASTT